MEAKADGIVEAEARDSCIAAREYPEQAYSSAMASHGVYHTGVVASSWTPTTEEADNLSEGQGQAGDCMYGA